MRILMCHVAGEPHQLSLHSCLTACAGGVHTFFPNIFKFNNEMIIDICNRFSDIDPIFDPRDDIPFSAGSINLGPQVVTRPHTDHANPTYGVCAITALGRFNCDKGRHLVLPKLGLVIQFPPGATIILPSAAIVHYNLPIQPGEERFSLVQYTAVGFFRWRAHGYQTTVQYRRVHNIKAPEQRVQAAAQLVAGINRFTRLDNIEQWGMGIHPCAHRQ